MNINSLIKNGTQCQVLSFNYFKSSVAKAILFTENQYLFCDSYKYKPRKLYLNRRG